MRYVSMTKPDKPIVMQADEWQAVMMPLALS